MGRYSLPNPAQTFRTGPGYYATTASEMRERDALCPVLRDQQPVNGSFTLTNGLPAMAITNGSARLGSGRPLDRPGQLRFRLANIRDLHRQLPID